MPKATWPHNEAKRLRSIALKTDQPIVFETGYGPSGLPHIGTFAEVARTQFVIKALRHSVPDAKIRLIAFSDDMDGLRSVPENLPNHAMLQDHLGMPLSAIPDPFAEQASFAGYMNGQLQHFLDSYGFTYEFFSSTKCYQGGVFDAGLKKVMDSYDAIRDMFVATISPEKRAHWSPFFPICDACGKIYSTRVVNIDKDRYELTYHCDQPGNGFTPCGHSQTTSILGGHVKVGWKIDWALRWLTFGVNYEMYGKDLINSATMASKICAVLGGKPPLLYKYELFLDEKGAKISKKIGNGISMDQWSNYSPIGGLVNFLVANPNKARQMGMPILPKIVDEYIQVLRNEDANNTSASLWFSDSITRGHDASCLETNEINYTLLTNVARNLGIHDAALLYEYAVKYEPSLTKNETFFRTLCEKVVAYVSDYEEQHGNDNIEIDLAYAAHLPELIDVIATEKNFNSLSGEEIQNLMFIIPKKHDLNQGDWFKFLYGILLAKEKGPRLGPFLAILGQEKVLSMLKQAEAIHCIK